MTQSIHTSSGFDLSSCVKVCFVLVKFVFLSLALINSISCATWADKWLNDVTIEPPYQASPKAIELHNSLTIVDLHADPLLWNRDLLLRGTHGHVDLPRLQEANVAVQVFGVVTGVPLLLSLENNADGYDVIGLLACKQGWPEETHDSRLQRALFQAARLESAVTSSQGALQMIRTGADVDTLMQARQQGTATIGALLSLEGAHALEGDPDNINTLFNAGFRMLGLVHLMDNDMAGSAHGVDQHGLTQKGRLLVERALSLGMIIDLAHASAKTLDEVLQMVEVPVVVSHGGVKGTCDTVRNLEDRHVEAVAATGGIIGIGLYEYATCGKTIEDTVRAMRYVADLVGVEHVALGSDFDGATETMFDATGLVVLTEALLEANFSRSEIQAIMGKNALRVFRNTLP